MSGEKDSPGESPFAEPSQPLKQKASPFEAKTGGESIPQPPDADSAAVSAEKPQPWQPFTFGGVAAFARARMTRLFAVEFAAAFVVAVISVWFLHRAYCPVILQAIQKMPETARIAGGLLQGVPDTLVAESRFLAVAAIPKAGERIGQDADLQLQLRQTDLCAESIFRPDWGWQIDYGHQASLNLSRSNLEPWWSAWQPILLAGVGAAIAVSLLMAWAAFAAIYMVPAKIIAWFGGRFLSWRSAWRMCSAGMMPGAVIMMAAMVLYGCSVIDLVGLSFCTAVHMVVGWIYIAGASFKAGKPFSQAITCNPFKT